MSDVSAREKFWSVAANPAAHAHVSWGDKLADWPTNQRFSEEAMLAPTDLLSLFCHEQDRFDQRLLCAGLIAYMPAIRRVISGQDLSRLNAMLTPQSIAALFALKPALTLSDQLCPVSAAPLLDDGLHSARRIGIGLLAGCTNSLAGAWSHYLKIRVADSEAFLIDQASALSHEELPERLAWFAHGLSSFVTTFANDSSAD